MLDASFNAYVGAYLILGPDVPQGAHRHQCSLVHVMQPCIWQAEGRPHVICKPLAAVRHTDKAASVFECLWRHMLLVYRVRLCTIQAPVTVSASMTCKSGVLN
jgi:hypothetical protein